MVDYRHGARRCPGCDEVMEEQAAAGAHLDVCPRCRGIWIDWQDGAVRGVLDELGAQPPGAPASRGQGACPVCATPLHEERSLAAPILRCGGCVGAFVPRGSFDALAAETTTEGLDEPPLLTRILDAVARFITPG